MYAEYIVSGEPNLLPQAQGPWCNICKTNGHRPQDCPLLHEYVQVPKNLFCTFCQSVGHSDKYYRAYGLMQERTQDMYAMLADQQGNVGTVKYNQGRVGRGNYRGRGRGRVIGRGQGPITCYRCH